MPKKDGDLVPAMTLQLECFHDDLSDAQLAAFKQAETEHNDIRGKLSEVVKESDNIFAGEIFKAYQLSGLAPELEKISKPISELKKQTEKHTKGSTSTKKEKVEKESTTTTVTTTSNRGRPRSDGKRGYQEMEVDDYDDDDDYIPLSKRVTARKQEKKARSPTPPPPPPPPPTKGKKSKGPAVPEQIPKSFSSNVRPSENTAVGGLSIGDNKKGNVVDLTSDDSGSKVAADSREISFNKLQGKTFPSLVVVARPCLKVKDSTPSDRGTLDTKVKSVLMHTATKFTEWLIQQGLVRSEQMCMNHTGLNLKLGMYSDATKFPYSGGYVWISDCCQARFVSVFNGSLFEGSPHPPSVLLKLIYHWACQTNVQNVVQWVKVDNLFVKGLYTWLRAVCTVALHQHMTLLGGLGKKIEVGVISLGTTTQDGQQRQVKVEVLGVLDPEGKLVRLRAVEPLSDGERNYKKRFSKILEPLSSWVHKDSIILTDLTVDKGTLHSLGYKTVHQTSSTDTSSRNTNCHIMDYLRRIVPRMFQNTLSLLSRQIIQQFLDELVWREWYGVSPGQAFENVVSHIAEQTRLVSKDTLVTRLNRVAANPFKNWGHLAVKASASKPNANYASPGETSSKGKKGTKRREPSPLPVIETKRQHKETAKKIESKKELPSKTVKKPEIKKAEVKKPEVKKVEIKKVEKKPVLKKEVVDDLISLEDFYYGICGDKTIAALEIPDFRVQCPECNDCFYTAVEFMTHIFSHASQQNDDLPFQCRYCLENWASEEALNKHTVLTHPVETKNAISSTYNCIICENRFSTIPMLGGHMQKFHFTREMPYKCCACNYASSSHHKTVDHFYEKHRNSPQLQCPFCLKGNTVWSDDKMLPENARAFLTHLRRHIQKSTCKKCTRCNLWFMHRGALKAHQICDHMPHPTHENCKITPVCPTFAKIFKPKTTVRNFAQKDLATFKVVERIPKLTIGIEDGQFCLECGTNMDDMQHLMGLLKCHKCHYKTCCMPAMLDHAPSCTGSMANETANIVTLDLEMHCLCGFSSSEGNALARHLATCERRSAYPSIEAVAENTVKRNMLDMLGLVRRDDESGEGQDEMLQPPAPQEDGTENIDNAESSVELQNDTSGVSGSADVSMEDVSEAPMVEPHFSQPHQIGSVGGGSGVAGGEGDEVYVQPQPYDDRFNTNLSLDDLGPQSVLPPPADIDRTPQLHEYQSLTTPQVPPIEHGGNDNDY